EKRQPAVRRRHHGSLTARSHFTGRSLRQVHRQEKVPAIFGGTAARTDRGITSAHESSRLGQSLIGDAENLHWHFRFEFFCRSSAPGRGFRRAKTGICRSTD